MRTLNTTLGFYSPTFLRMHVGTKKSLINLSNLNDDFAESVYLHEFCHFIQDITTSYGLSNICITVDYMKFVNNYIIRLPEGTFDVPVDPIPNASDNVHSNLELHNIYNGYGNGDEIEFINSRRLTKNVQTRSGTLNVPFIEIECTTNGTTDTFVFGAVCVLESMAYIIERSCYPNCELSPDVPYLSAEKLVELIYPDFGREKLNVLALCDASLKHVNPGVFFYDTLLEIRDKNHTINKPEDIYSVCNKASIDFKGTKTLNDLFAINSKDAKKQILDYFNDPHFQPLKDWLESMIDEAVKFRMQHETFPLDIARGDKIAVNKVLADFMRKVGTPLVTNELGETTLVDPRSSSTKPNYSTIWAIDQIHSVFWGWQRHCELVGLCCSSGIQTDMRCTNAPWERNLEPNCAFGQMWRHWGLSKYAPN